MRAIVVDRPDRVSLGLENSADVYARAAIDGQDVFGFIGGEFSLIDAISACVKHVPGARLTLSTWTAAKADMDHVIHFLNSGAVSRVRWIVDRSFQNRQPDLCRYLRDRFGDDAIRVQPVHCKFALIENDDVQLLMQTSANLNRNRRLENLNLTTCPVLFAAYKDLVQQIFDVQEPEEGFTDPASPRRAMKQLFLEQQPAPFELKMQRKVARLQKKIERARR